MLQFSLFIVAEVNKHACSQFYMMIHYMFIYIIRELVSSKEKRGLNRVREYQKQIKAL